MINKYSKIIKRSLFFAIIIICILFSYFVMVRYEVEGEKEMPFNIEKILIMSTVTGMQDTHTENIWNLNIAQNNDLYLYIGKKNNSDDVLKKITIENFNITKSPKKGNIKIYRPTGELSNLYTYSEQNYINEKIEYTGSTIDDLKTLEVSNQGGIISIRIATEEIGKYISDSDSEEIIHNSSLLTKSGITEEDINFTISFDMIIEIEKGIKYKGTIELNLPSENLIEKGSSNIEITNFDNVVFKRIK